MKLYLSHNVTPTQCDVLQTEGVVVIWINSSPFLFGLLTVWCNKSDWFGGVREVDIIKSHRLTDSRATPNRPILGHWMFNPDNACHIAKNSSPTLDRFIPGQLVQCNYSVYCPSGVITVGVADVLFSLLLGPDILNIWLVLCKICGRIQKWKFENTYFELN